MNVAIANAPVSYGAFELTVGIDPSVPDGTAVLDEVAAAGYAGIDLGPVGYLGRGAELAERLASRGLGLAGGYLELPFSDSVALASVYSGLDAMLDTFDAVRGAVPGPDPRPTIADAGSDERRAAPGRSSIDRSLGLDAEGWERFGEGLRAVVARCRDRGYEPTLHPETGTYRRGALGGRGRHGAVRCRRVPRDRSPLRRGRRPGAAWRGSGRVASTTSTSKMRIER